VSNKASLVWNEFQLTFVINLARRLGSWLMSLVGPRSGLADESDESDESENYYFIIRCGLRMKLLN
jgi:hypothetical protein